MKLFIVASMIALSAAGRLDRQYLPPGFNGPFPGSGPLLQPGSGPSLQPVGGPSAGPPRPSLTGEAAAQIVKLDSDVTATGFQYSYETQNGISAQASGEDQGGGLRSQGAFAYPGTDGQQYTLTYTADENGFQPQGAHLPTSPPIPEEILKSIEQNARDEAAGIRNEGSYNENQNGGSQGAIGGSQVIQLPSNQFSPSVGTQQQSFSPQSGYRY